LNRGYVARIPLTQETTLQNGIRVASEAKAGQTAAISVIVNTGSGHETEKNNGIAHFLEHLAFKGTFNRSKHQLELEIENMGGTLNAFTSREHTVYIAKVFKYDVDKAVDILSDIIQHSKYDPNDITYEKGVVLREMEEVNKNVEEFAMDHLHEIAFAGSSLGYTILGPQHNIENFTREGIVEYVNSYYTCNRIAIIGAGAVDHNQLVDLTKDKFVALRQSSPQDLCTLPDATFHGSYRNLQSNISAKNYGVLAFKGASWSSGEMIPLLVIQTLIGAFDAHMGIGNQLFSNLAHRVAAGNPNCESIKSFITSYDTTGLVGCSFSTSDKDMEQLLKTITLEYSSLAKTLTEQDVSRAKHRLKASMAMMYDGVVPVCEDMGRQLLTIGRRVPLQEFFDRIDAVDLDVVRNTCIRHFVDINPAIVTVGDVEDLDYEKVNEWSKW